MGSVIFVVPNQYVIFSVYQLINRMKTILVPTDLSDQANMALSVAVSLATQHGADVRVLHYLPTAIIDPGLSAAAITIGRYLKEQEADAQTALTALCEHYQTHAVRVTPVLSRHEKGLFGAVTEEDVDLVVLASHGAGGWAEWLIGSNAQHFVQTGDCPVLVVKQANTEYAPKKVLFAIDADDRLKTQFNYPLSAADAHREFLFITVPNDPRVTEGIRAWMAELADAQGLTDYHLTILPYRVVYEGIIDYARQHNFDLIVLYTSQRTGFWHFFNGSVAEDVVNHAPMPVLVIPLRSE